MEQIPHKCPACDGEGQRLMSPGTENIKYENCRACHGSGVVWGWKTSEPQCPPVQPYWCIYPCVPEWEPGTTTIKVGTVTCVTDASAMDNLPPHGWVYTA